MRCAVLIALLASPVASEEREVFYGTWGTPEQCTGTPIKPGGTVRAEPFEINPEWLRHGEVWCRLSWFPVEPREDGFFTGAQAQCGEDAVRGYRLGMELSGDELLLRWGFLLSNGPLQRCQKP
ncbi:MAG: hypothetical protein AAF415_09460 [Pseudomonadota bacterium]